MENNNKDLEKVNNVKDGSVTDEGRLDDILRKADSVVQIDDSELMQSVKDLLKNGANS
jgi:hypothetical protein